ncbi:MAG TPA: ergothioneine biosynthesis protein EgtB, partial [Pseudomonadales bacterium]|nr:ergothioneine biosynthesis protein EgtB [Pseudomonadales bacterium]
FNEAFEVLFNSYYNGVGSQFPRPERGRLSRPTVDEVVAYREHVDEHMLGLLGRELSGETLFRTILGLNHEQQHQELLFTDLKYNLGNNPLYPPYAPRESTVANAAPGMEFVEFPGGIFEIGTAADEPGSFAFDNESPRHQVLVPDFALASRLVTNGEYLAFMEDAGYRRPELWLSDAWSRLNGPDGSDKPLYWVRREGDWYEYTLGGLEKLNLAAPVGHVSGYEADAYARWAGARLPTEPEWEVMAQDRPVEGNLAESGRYHPAPARAGRGMQQVFGDVWEWTSTSYGPYPGFKPFAGALGEYNGKFMANQLVLRGGSCVTPQSHLRPSYRNFFYPGDRWQFSGIRLARDCP